MRKIAILLGSTAMLLTPTIGAQANTATQENVLDEIIVTAQRRAERLQDVPVAITAASVEQLELARVENIANISTISPSVQFTNGNISSSSANIQIRGLGTTGVSRSFEGAVGVFIDGVYRSRAGAALQSFNDIDSLQILRGPQGTLFGKNTSAGAVLLTSAAPSTGGTEGRAEATYGNYNTYNVKAAVNIPVSEDSAIRVSGLYSHKDGFYKDVNTGKHVNNDETKAIKAQYLVDASESVQIRLIADYLESSGNCCYGTSNYVDGPTQPLIDALTVAKGLKLPSKRPKDFEVAQNFVTDQTTKDYGGALLTDINIGDDVLKSVTAIRKFSVAQFNDDADFSGADLFKMDESFKSRFISQEFTYNGTLDSLNGNYVVGAYYAHEKLAMDRVGTWTTQAQVYWDTLLATQGLPAGTVSAKGKVHHDGLSGSSESIAGFSHFDFKVGDNWNLIAGARYSIEKKKGRFAYRFYTATPNEVMTVLGVQPGPAYDRELTNRALSGTLGVQYHPSETSMVYLTYNRGFKSGGVNIDANAGGTALNNPTVTPGAKPLDPAFRPEKVDAFELGTKIEYMDRRARTNIALFHNEVKDLQVAQFVGLQFTVLNARSAKTQGVEVENLFQLSDSVTLGLDGTWLPKAAFGTDSSIDPVLSGHRFRYAPKFTGNASLLLDQPISDSLNLIGRLQYQYSGPQYLNTASLTKQGAVEIVNANLGVKSSDGRWEIGFWALNVFNEIYGTYGFNTPFQNGDQNYYLAPPRTFGVTARTNF
ncbi:TonB-dependent receptor [Niveispirillum sp. BGYR6]|uniref:TonB-dependent receptor n=1 Tax=Niveispirillum sp. BGYR6 TaxID=2971249 RepID=UPI0022B9AC20|nr:TonB-dependent receptor [Niveispirillum sp. BGYR6]MDG5493284.1 TonB-dependent receptor [Niveispirillum sp. BGYR6]